MEMHGLSAGAGDEIRTGDPQLGKVVAAIGQALDISEFVDQPEQTVWSYAVTGRPVLDISGKTSR